MKGGEFVKFRSIYIKILKEVFLMFVALICLFPIAWMISTSLKSNSEVYTSNGILPKVFHFDNYVIAWTQGISTYFLNSVFYVICVVSAVVFIASLAAYSFAKLQFPFKKFVFGLFVASIMIPVPGSFVPIYVLLVKLHIQNTRIGYMMPLVAGGLAMAIFILKTFFESVPKTIEEAAKIDGCNKFMIYWRIIIPLSVPALSTIIIFNTLGVWNEYLLATVIFTDNKLMPIQQGISTFIGQHFTSYELYMSATIIALAPIILLYIFLNKQVLKGLTAGAIKE